MGTKHVKKLVTSAFQRNLKTYLDRWRKRTLDKRGQADGAERIIRRLRQRMFRVAWNRYRTYVAWAEQD